MNGKKRSINCKQTWPKQEKGKENQVIIHHHHNTHRHKLPVQCPTKMRDIPLIKTMLIYVLKKHKTHRTKHQHLQVGFPEINLIPKDLINTKFKMVTTVMLFYWTVKITEKMMHHQNLPTSILKKFTTPRKTCTMPQKIPN